MEVIYTGLRQTPAQIVAAVVQEDARVLGLSILSGAHNQIFPEVMRLLKEQDVNDVLVFAGGIIPDEDIPGLKAIGIQAIFQPGTNTDDVVAFIHETLAGTQA
jgi:methylmalonyl-CoA mutase C-terminal domain/subunit